MGAFAAYWVLRELAIMNRGRVNIFLGMREYCGHGRI